MRSAAESNGWKEKARLKKVHLLVGFIDGRLCSEKLNPHDPESARRIVEQLAAASDAQWHKLENDAQVNELSPDSRAMLLDIYRERAGKAAENDDDAQLVADMLAHPVSYFDDLQRRHEDFSVNGVSCHVRGKQDPRKRGFTWNLDIRGEFQCSGFARGEWQTAVEQARAAAVERLGGAAVQP